VPRNREARVPDVQPRLRESARDADVRVALGGASCWAAAICRERVGERKAGVERGGEQEWQHTPT
jgi:hypothetical protein